MPELTREEVLDVLGEFLDLLEVDPAEPFEDDASVDSREMLRLISRLETRFGVQMSAQDLVGVHYLNDLVEVVRRLAAREGTGDGPLHAAERSPMHTTMNRVMGVLAVGLLALLSAGCRLADGVDAETGATSDWGDEPQEQAADTAATARIYQFDLPDIDGKPVSLSQFAGNVLLIVNVASKCGFTPQYAGLQKLYESYGDRGLVVLGFPANNFRNQEPGTNADIKAFCRTNYGVTFPMFSKISVEGDDKAPLYAYLTEGVEDESLRGEIGWNFTKFLVGRDGRVLARFEPAVTPEDSELLSAVQRALDEAPQVPEAASAGG
jgi:glutathione peroxidase